MLTVIRAQSQSQHEVLTDFHLPPFLCAGILENQRQMKKKSLCVLCVFAVNTAYKF
jgi:hypothetical protein